MHGQIEDIVNCGPAEIIGFIPLFFSERREMIMDNIFFLKLLTDRTPAPGFSESGLREGHSIAFYVRTIRVVQG